MVKNRMKRTHTKNSKYEIDFKWARYAHDLLEKNGVTADFVSIISEQNRHHLKSHHKKHWKSCYHWKARVESGHKYTDIERNRTRCKNYVSHRKINKRPKYIQKNYDKYLSEFTNFVKQVQSEKDPGLLHFSHHLSKRGADPSVFQSHRVECSASNDLGDSIQPCVFLISTMGEYCYNMNA